MMIVERLFRAKETRSHSVLLDALRRGHGVRANSGRAVTPNSALSYSAVLACVRVLSESVASLPLHLYERNGAGNKSRATDKPLYAALHSLANPENTAFELREFWVKSLALWGNAYTQIMTNNRGDVVELWPLRPDRMDVERDEAGNIRYMYKVNGGAAEPIPPWQVFHVRGMGGDGLVGYSLIRLAREAIGLGLALEEFGARYFGQGAKPSIVLKHPGTLSTEAQSRLRDSWASRYGGLENSHLPAVLEEGLDFEAIGIPPEDSQFLQSRSFQSNEIARIFRVPPHMIANLEHATFSNIEHQSIDFVIHTLRPWLVRIEQAIQRDLLTPADRLRYSAEHLVDGLLRGDTESRYQAYAVGRQNGWLSANDIRKLENMNPVAGGDTYLIPLNMVPVDEAGQPTDDEARQLGPARETRQALEPVEIRARRMANDRLKLVKSFKGSLLRDIKRLIKREVADVKRGLNSTMKRRSAADFAGWLTSFYQDYRQVFYEQILPILMTYAAQVGLAVERELDLDDAGDIMAFIESYALSLARRHAGESEYVLQKLLSDSLANAEDPVEVIEAELDQWSEDRAEKIADKEANASNNAFAKAFYVVAGIQFLRWVTVGESCPYCRNLDGKIVGIQHFFVEKDTEFKPDGADYPLNPRHNVGHPPLHGGCDCMITAESE